MTKLDQHFIDIDACKSGREWVAKNCTTAAECWERLLDDGRIDRAIWWHVRDRGWKSVESLVRRWVLRAARVHAAKAMDSAGLTDQASRLRGLADDASFDEIRSTANAAAFAAAANAAFAAADAAAAAAAFAADERKQQAADMRELCECPWTEDQP